MAVCHVGNARGGVIILFIICRMSTKSFPDKEYE